MITLIKSNHPESDESNLMQIFLNSLPNPNPVEPENQQQEPPKKKKFARYAFEFLIVFLAVFMGFVADNYREHLSDKERELIYISNLIRDLKKDDVVLSDIIEKNEKHIVAIDSFTSIRSYDFTRKPNTDSFYVRLVKAQLWKVLPFKPNEITLSQLKSGGLSILRPKIADLIAELDLSVQELKWFEKFPTDHAEETFRIVYELTDYPTMGRVYFSKKGNFPPLQIGDKIKLMKFFNLSFDLKLTLEGYNNHLKDHQALIRKTIGELEGEYDR